MPIFRLLVLVGLVRLLIVTNKPWLCAGFYASLSAVMAVVFSHSITSGAISGGIAFVSSGIYFWLLNRFDGSFVWWIIMPLGLILGFI